MKLETKADPSGLIGLRVLGDFHESHPMRGREGTIVAIDAENWPLVLWDRCRKPRRQHPTLLIALKSGDQPAEK